ncbi:MAG: hypothetical protein U0P45_09940 [Acidimicrobiales bacterium]
MTAAVGSSPPVLLSGGVEFGADPVMPCTGPAAPVPGASTSACGLSSDCSPTSKSSAARYGASRPAASTLRSPSAPAWPTEVALAVTIWIDGTPTADRIILNLADAMALTITCQDAPTDLQQARALLQAHLKFWPVRPRQAADAPLGDLALVRLLDRIEQVLPTGCCLDDQRRRCCRLLPGPDPTHALMGYGQRFHRAGLSSERLLVVSSWLAYPA